MQDLAALIQNFGLAVAILIVLGVFLWRLLVWLKPWIEKLVSAHLAFVASTSEAVAKISETVDELKLLHTETAHQLQSTANQLGDIATTSKRASEILQAMANKQSEPGSK